MGGRDQRQPQHERRGQSEEAAQVERCVVDPALSLALPEENARDEVGRQDEEDIDP